MFYVLLKLFGREHKDGTYIEDCLGGDVACCDYSSTCVRKSDVVSTWTAKRSRAVPVLVVTRWHERRGIRSRPFSRAVDTYLSVYSAPVRDQNDEREGHGLSSLLLDHETPSSMIYMSRGAEVLR